MKLDEYTDPADPYAPRPDASKRAAAAKIARAAQNATEPIAPEPPPAVRQYLPFGIGAGVLILLMVVAATYQLARGPARPLAIAPTAALPSSSTAPAAPTAAPAPTTVPQWVIIAYAAPAGVPLGPVDLAGEAAQAVARAGADWVMLQRPNGDRVWFRRADLPPNLLVPDSLPDLAPRPAR